MLLHDRKEVHDICQVRARQFTWEKTANTLLQNYKNLDSAQHEKIFHNVFEFGQVA
jgi:hypothetical protein